MREWNLKLGDPLSLTLAADVRMGPTDYCNDQIWELSLSGGVPQALALQTTFGLRARILRLFPAFAEGDTLQIDPITFFHPPVIKQIYPNFLSLGFSPFPDIDVDIEYWVPQSHGLAARIRFNNTTPLIRRIRFDLIGQLYPNDGQRMVLTKIQSTTVLVGSTGNLAPVIFLTSGPEAKDSPYTSLTLNIELHPNKTRQFIWSIAALPDAEASFALARSLASSKWEAERSRLDMVNGSQIEIHTGDPDWDATFMLTQKQAVELLVGPTSHLPHPSFVQTRQPDQGYSLRGDGTDYNHFWNGQSPLETYYLSSLILHQSPQLAQGLIYNFLSVQSEDGSIDWKPGLAGQRSNLLATPILASLAWRIFESTQDQSFLKNIFSGLYRFIQAWFTPVHDRDGDSIPEWDHPLQTGFDDHPIYSHWHEWSQGVDISTAESTSLCALLYKECQSLIQMAQILDQHETIPTLQSLANQLKLTLEAEWDPADVSYFDWDRDSHYSTRGQWLGGQNGSGTILVQREFEHPIRILVDIRVPVEGRIGGSTRPRPHLFIHGIGSSGQHRVEHLTDNKFKWFLGGGHATSEYVYTTLDKIEIQGLQHDDWLAIYSVGYHHQDHTLLTPLWAGVPDTERAQLLIEQTLLNPDQFWHDYGIPACPRPPENPEAIVSRAVHMPWNVLIGEGLLYYGYRTEAAELVTRLMSGIIQTLKREGVFYRYYLADSGQGVGERNALNGLAPLSLFLETLGVRLISPHKVSLVGFNPFSWPVTVKYRGMTILRQKDKTTVIFPDGQTVLVNDPAPQLISLEMEQAN